MHDDDPLLLHLQRAFLRSVDLALAPPQDLATARRHGGLRGADVPPAQLLLVLLLWHASTQRARVEVLGAVLQLVAERAPATLSAVAAAVARDGRCSRARDAAAAPVAAAPGRAVSECPGCPAKLPAPPLLWTRVLLLMQHMLLYLHVPRTGFALCLQQLRRCLACARASDAYAT